MNSNADTQFSFTNALGTISAEQVRGIEIATSLFPQARWVIALHHHLVEYPRAGTRARRADRHGSDQRQRIRASVAALGGSSRRDARTPTYRLDRRMCGSSYRVSAVSSDGGTDNGSDLFLHSLSGCWRRWATRIAASATVRCERLRALSWSSAASSRSSDSIAGWCRTVRPLVSKSNAVPHFVSRWQTLPILTIAAVDTPVRCIWTPPSKVAPSSILR